jgi:hypothetical protein
LSNLGTSVHLGASSGFLVGPGFGCQSNYGVFGPLVQNFEKSSEPEMELETGKKIGTSPKINNRPLVRIKIETSPKTWFMVLKILRFQLSFFVRHVISLRKIIKVLNNKNDIKNNILRVRCGAH